MMMRLLPSASTQMGATPLAPGTRRTWVVSTPCRSKLARVSVAVAVIAERVDHRDLGAHPARHDRLVGTLAAEPLGEPLAEHRLATLGHPLEVRDLVDHRAADHGQPGAGPARHRRVPSRSDATSALMRGTSVPSGPSASTSAEATTTPSPPASAMARACAGFETPKPTATGTGDTARTSRDQPPDTSAAATSGHP